MNPAMLDLARRQRGALARRQLRDGLGLSNSAIDRMLRCGTLVGVGRGIYRLRSAPDGFAFRSAAATLYGGAPSFLSGRTAARWYGLSRMRPAPIELTVAAVCRWSAPGWIDLRFSTWFEAVGDRRPIEPGVVIASPLRMLWGLAADLHPKAFERAADEAWSLGLIDPLGAADYLERHRCRGKNGVSTLERWLDVALGQRAPAQSNLERDVIAALAAAGLPPAERQFPLEMSSGEVIHLDIAWPARRLAVEPGHSRWHGGHERQRRDRHRDAGCAELGWLVMRFDEHMLRDLDGCVASIRRAYHARSPVDPRAS